MLDSGGMFDIDGNQNSKRRLISPSFWIDSRDQLATRKIHALLLYVGTSQKSEVILMD
jgi:hypothetical protein